MVSLFSIIEILKGGIRMLDGTIRDETEASALTYRQDVIDIYSNRTRSFYRTFLKTLVNRFHITWPS